MGNSHLTLKKTKITRTSQNQNILYVTSQMQGWRPDMQDESISKLQLYHPKSHIRNSLFGVFDGHGTNYISIFVREVFQKILTSLKQYQNEQYQLALLLCFQKVDQFIVSQKGQDRLRQIKKVQDQKSISNLKIPTGEKIGYFCGCTANVVLITQTYYYIANCGDSRSVLFKNDITINLSRDHTPIDYSQSKRILEAGGFIKRGRVNDTINVSRAFGDFQFKRSKQLPFQHQIVTCLPQIQVIKRTQNDQFILIGCDGIWQKFGNKSQILVDYILKTRTFQRKKYVKCIQQLLDHLVAKKSTQQLGQDNMSVILIKFLQ